MSRSGAEQAREVIENEYPQANYQEWNCRKISGSTSWSEHSWGGALDIFHEDYGISTDPNNQAFLDKVYAYLQDNWERLSIRTLLWRVPDHYNHIHVDFWPRGYGTPPCADGKLQSQYSWGAVVAGDPGPENGEVTVVQGIDFCEYGDSKSNTVEYWQRIINKIGKYELEIDGDYGAATKDAVAKITDTTGDHIGPKNAKELGQKWIRAVVKDMS